MKTLGLIVLCLYHFSCFAQATPKINGVSFVASREEIAQVHIDEVLRLHANHAAVMPFGFIRDINSPRNHLQYRPPMVRRDQARGHAVHRTVAQKWHQDHGQAPDMGLEGGVHRHPKNELGGGLENLGRFLRTIYYHLRGNGTGDRFRTVLHWHRTGAVCIDASPFLEKTYRQNTDHL